MARDFKHPSKAIEQAVAHAEANGWRVEKSRGHAWGRLFCPHNDSDCRCGEFCITSVWSTPRTPEAHARQIRRVVDKCTGGADESV
ncbi:hypothetical protein [Salinisphaera sp.]|uniref:hypothetical protein n=1 Tax=Salinisphaera sp. TaxID=1914330 RepID=UPI003C79FAEF